MTSQLPLCGCKIGKLTKQTTTPWPHYIAPHHGHASERGHAGRGVDEVVGVDSDAMPAALASQLMHCRGSSGVTRAWGVKLGNLGLSNNNKKKTQNQRGLRTQRGGGHQILRQQVSPTSDSERAAGSNGRSDGGEQRVSIASNNCRLGASQVLVAIGLSE